MPPRRWAPLVALTFVVACGPAPSPEAPDLVIVPEDVQPRGYGAAAPRSSQAHIESTPSSAPLRQGRANAPPGESVTPERRFGGCLRSPLCGLEGLCSPREDDLCIAEDDDDCRGSDACLGGRCTAKDGVCVASNDEDCRDSWACKGYGRCFYDGDVACMAKDVADCQASTRCKREGECVLRGGECIKP